MTAPDPLPLGHPVVLLAACPPAMAVAAGTAVVAGASVGVVVLLTVLAPLLLSTLGGGLLLLSAGRTRPRSVSPLPEEAEAPAVERRRPMDLVRREAELRETEAALLRAAVRSPEPPYAELLVLAERLRRARLEHAEVVLQLGGSVEPGLRDEVHLRALLPEMRPALTADELRNRLGEAP